MYEGGVIKTENRYEILSTVNRHKLRAGKKQKSQIGDQAKIQTVRKATFEFCGKGRKGKS